MFALGLELGSDAMVVVRVGGSEPRCVDEEVYERRIYMGEREITFLHV